jgi:NADH-quinone oxidoreductase subunit N
MVAAVIAAFLYLRLMVTMWTSDPAVNSDGSTEPVAVPFSIGVAIVAAVAFTLVVGIVPGWLIDAADTVTAYAR